METIFYGFLLGIGIILATLLFCAIGCAIFLFCMFISYLSEKRKRREKEAQDRRFE